MFTFVILNINIISINLRGDNTSKLELQRLIILQKKKSKIPSQKVDKKKKERKKVAQFKTKVKVKKSKIKNQESRIIKVKQKVKGGISTKEKAPQKITFNTINFT